MSGEEMRADRKKIDDLSLWETFHESLSEIQDTAKYVHAAEEKLKAENVKDFDQNADPLDMASCIHFLSRFHGYNNRFELEEALLLRELSIISQHTKSYDDLLIATKADVANLYITYGDRTDQLSYYKKAISYIFEIISALKQTEQLDIVRCVSFMEDIAELYGKLNMDIEMSAIIEDILVLINNNPDKFEDKNTIEKMVKIYKSFAVDDQVVNYLMHKLNK